MGATPEFNATVATGVPAVPLPEYDSLVCVIGTTNDGTLEPRPWGSSDDIEDEYVAGPACRDARHLVSRTGLGLLVQRADTDTPGSYDTIDNSEFTGTAVPATVASVVPYDAGEVYIRFVEGGDVLTDGITYYASDDNGRMGADTLYRLGTASRITIASINAAVELDPPTATLAAYVDDLRLMTIAHFASIGNLDGVVNLANDIKAKYEAHRVLTAGSVHGAADSTNAVSSPNATDLASAITLLNELRTDYEAHRILTAGSVHGAADSTNAISAPIATNLATAVALANDLRTKYEAHRVLTSGSVHGAADNTNTVLVNTVAATHGAADGSSGSGIPGTTVSTLALARTCMIALKAAALLHVVLISGSVHGAADLTAQTALNAISISSSSTGQQVLTAALAYADAMFGDGSTTDDAHTLRTASSIHGIEDTTNLLTATVPTRGTVAAGDIIRVATNAPAFSNTTLANAFTALANSDHDPSMLLISGRILPANLATIATGLGTLQSAGKRCTVISQARKLTDGESLSDWRAALTSEWASSLDYRVAVCAGEGLATFTDGTYVRQYARGFSTQAVRRLMQIDRFRTAWEVELGRLEDFTISDSNGIVIGHDEGTSPGLKAAKFWTIYRPKSSSIGRVAFLNFDVTRFDQPDRVRSVRVNRITNRMILEIQAVGLGLLGKTYDVKRLSPTSGTLSQKAIDAIKPKFEQPIKNGFKNDISDYSAADLITIGSSVTIDSDTDAFDLTVTIRFTPKLPVGRVSATFAVRLGV